MRGTPVDGHLPKMVTPEIAAAAGQRTIEHMLSLGFACSAQSDAIRAEYARFTRRWPTLDFPDNLVGYFSLERKAWETRDPAVCATKAEQLARAGVAVTPTIFIEWLEPADIVADSTRMAMLPASVSEHWREWASGRDYIGEILGDVFDASTATVRQPTNRARRHQDHDPGLLDSDRLRLSALLQARAITRSTRGGREALPRGAAHEERACDVQARIFSPCPRLACFS